MVGNGRVGGARGTIDRLAPGGQRKCAGCAKRARTCSPPVSQSYAKRTGEPPATPLEKATPAPLCAVGGGKRLHEREGAPARWRAASGSSMRERIPGVKGTATSAAGHVARPSAAKRVAEGCTFGLSRRPARSPRPILKACRRVLRSNGAICAHSSPSHRRRACMRRRGPRAARCVSGYLRLAGATQSSSRASWDSSRSSWQHPPLRRQALREGRPEDPRRPRPRSPHPEGPGPPTRTRWPSLKSALRRCPGSTMI